MYRPHREQAQLLQGISVGHRMGQHPKSTVGAKLARDGCLTFNKDAGCTGLIASRLTPTRDPCRARNWVTPQNPLWEQSLLAMAAQHSTNLLNVPPSSRASSAPTEDQCRAQNGATPKIHCGSEPARDGYSTFNKSVECTALIASKLGSHRGSVSGADLGDAQSPL